MEGVPEQSSGSLFESYSYGLGLPTRQPIGIWGTSFFTLEQNPKRMMEPKKKLYWARTKDGWKIALHRYVGDSRFPVLLVHGLASNHTNFDFPVDELNFARYLNRQGFDCWIVDLRGSGLSKRSTLRPQKWCFDDFVFQDLPAAVDKILQVSKSTKIHWVGHSMGGVLAFPFFQTFSKTKVIRSLITVATPMTTHSKPGYFKYLYPLDGFIRLLPSVPYRTLSKIAVLFHRPILRMEDHVLFARSNMDENILKNLMNHSVESVPSSLILQIHDWLRHNRFASLDGKFNYLDKLDQIKLPILMAVGSIDTFTPEADLRLTVRKLPKANMTLKVFGKNNGHENDYGHIDLLLGKNSPREVFPELSKWLKRQDR